MIGVGNFRRVWRYGRVYCFRHGKYMHEVKGDETKAPCRFHYLFEFNLG